MINVKEWGDDSEGTNQLPKLRALLASLKQISRSRAPDISERPGEWGPLHLWGQRTDSASQIHLLAGSVKC